MKKRKRYTAQQKATIVLDLLKEEKSVAQIASEYGIQTNCTGGSERDRNICMKSSKIATKKTEKELQHMSRKKKSYMQKLDD